MPADREFLDWSTAETMVPYITDAGRCNQHVPGGNDHPNGPSLPGLHPVHDNALDNGSDVPKNASQEPIAICGMSCRLPGGLHTPQQLWEFLLAKGDARGPIPKSRYSASTYYSEVSKPGGINTEYGYFLDESIDIRTIDTSFFTMGKSEVERMDPHHRQMLEVARECLEDAGETNWQGQPIGCYMGSFGEDWVEMFAKDNQQYGLHRIGGAGDFMLSNRVSYEMDLTGPSMVVRTGCSAALVALHEACMGLSRGDCEGAIVGGANLILAPGMTTAMTEQAVLAPDGSCKTFSSDANGYARAEAISAIFIKSLANAIRDGNPVRAVIRGTATNSDGKGAGLGGHVPNDITQEALIRHVYQVAGIKDYSETGFVECHGTGTPVGDPIEAKAVGRVFGPTGGVQIGSVKPNLGHSEGASGLTSIIKSVLALENGVIPPNIKFNEPNPKIPWETYGLSVPLEPMPWPTARSERVSVNSFGIGGTNAHVILDSARSFGVSPVLKRPATSPLLLVYSANTVESLKLLISNFSEYIHKNPDTVSDLAFTLANRREHLPYRAFAVRGLFNTLVTSPPSKSGEAPNIVMVFTGQGAQWPQMGGYMIRSSLFPVFKKSIRSLDTHLRTLTDGPEWHIEEELLREPEASRVNLAELSQPLCTAIQVALVDTFASLGVQPGAVIGHSSGEIAAAYAAGAITATEAITIAFYRGKVTKLQTKPGAMAAIGMGLDDVQEFLQHGVNVACENSPKSVTLAGDTKAVEFVVSKIKETCPDVPVRNLRVDKAYHSPHMAEIGEKYNALIERHMSAKSPNKLFFSSVEGKLLGQDKILGPKYWQQNLESPVLFLSAVSSIIQHDIAKNMVFLELGPHSALAGPLRQTQAHLSNTTPYISAFIRNQNDGESFLTAIGKLFLANAHLDWSKVIPEGLALPDLPRYPWDHSRKFWYESRLTREWRHREHKYHDLLGVKVTESTDLDILFRNILHLDNVTWIRDHRIGDDIVFPFAGYAGMIGEAVRQVTGIDGAFKLRNVIVSSALVLGDGQPVEMVTTLRRNRLTNSLDSEWWEFTIASHNRMSWTKHCSGEARSHSEPSKRADTNKPLVRKVDNRRCYESMAQSGLNFGPAFRCLHDVQSDTVTQNATSEVDRSKTDGKSYHMHPTTIDALLQMLGVAASKGYANPTRKMVVPTRIKEMCIHRCDEDVQVRASASYTPNGSVIGSGQCVTAEGKVVLYGSGIRLSILDGDFGEAGDSFARTEWSPHVDFLEVNTLIKPLDDRSGLVRILTELSHLCMILTKRVIAQLDTSISHMHKYRSWIDRHLLSVDLQDFGSLDNKAIEQRVQSLVHGLSKTVFANPAVAIQKVCNNAKQIFTGETDALDLLVADDTLAKIYVSAEQCDVSQFIKHMTHSKPNLRVLEVGAGTGGATAKILKMLTAGNRKLYSSYTYTDISSGFFVAAKERFGGYSNIEYAVLDISKDPSEQGFDGQKYDLVVANNVIHATTSLHDSLRNVQQLLEPNGRVLLRELIPSSKWVNYIWGTLAGWWCGEADGRPDEPYVNVERWTRELTSAGFRAPDAAVSDAADPYQTEAVIVARPKIENVPDKRVTVLILSHSSRVHLMLRSLENRGYIIECRGLQDIPLPEDQDVIALLDDEGPFFEDMNDQRFSSFKALVESLNERGILWVTVLLQIQCQDPRFGQIHGVARAIRSELQIDFAVCEVDNFESSLDSIVDVFERFQMRKEGDSFRPELEYAILQNTVQVARIHPFSMQDELTTYDSSDSISLRIKRPGHLTALQWTCHEIEELRGGNVEVETHVAGLNFRDVLCAMGIIEAPESGFGLEGAGIVRCTGPDVKDLKPGDRVIVIGHCLFGTKVVVSENCCEKIPDGLRLEDAATMPCVFATSMYSLFDIGRLEQGQSLLIHSACGGVGLATIQLAQMVGAEIYATVGNEEKVKYLMDTFGLPRNKIFNSRSASFVDDVMRETNGRGVDLALNSLSGGLLHATWECIAEFGMMVEIGKRDLIGAGKLDMSPFLANRKYCCVDLEAIFVARPTTMKKLLKNIVCLVRENKIRPIRPIKVFHSDAILEAFRYMQQGLHLGKIVVSLRDADGQVNVSQNVQRRTKQARFDGSSSYLLIGGLGGLGRSISNWMVERGACHLIYLSRSAGLDQKHQEFAKELASMGCRADFVRGDVTRLEDVTKAVTYAQGRLKGILQLSMVLCDQSFTHMTREQWTTAIDPKVKGTWNLHNVSMSANVDLDFFVLFSSVSGVFGLPGQINYASANTFLDAFAQYRLGLGLPACSIDIGTVEGVGFVAENESVKQKLKNGGRLDGTVSETELFKAVEAAILWTQSRMSSQGLSNFCVGIRSGTSMNSPRNRSILKKDVRMAVFYNSEEADAASVSDSSDSLKFFIAAAKSDAIILRQPESIQLLAVGIGKQVFGLLLKPVENLQTSCSLADLGMDSLVAIELRQWWKKTFEFDISVLEMMGMSTLDALGEHAAKGMLKLFHGEE